MIGYNEVMNDNHLLAKIGQYALIRNGEDQLLVLERTRSYTWCLPGGRLDKNEEWDIAFIRELEEELGFECKQPRPFAVHILTDPYQTKYCVYFTVMSHDISALKLSDEHTSYRWIDQKEARELDFEDQKVREVVLEFFERNR